MNRPLPATESPLSRISAATQARRRRWRMAKDGMARHGVMIGGFGVIVAILLIFFYLLYVVFPLLEPASAEAVADYRLAGSVADTLHLAMEEQAEIAVRYDSAARVRFFATHDGHVIAEQALSVPAGVTVTSHAQGLPARGGVSLGLSDGSVLLTRHTYKVSFPEDRRLITPQLEFPLGEQPLPIDAAGQALERIAVQSGDRTIVAALTADQRLLLVILQKEESFLEESRTLRRFDHVLPNTTGRVRYLLVDPDQHALFVATDAGTLAYYDISDPEAPRLVQQLGVVPPGGRLTDLELLAGGISLLVSSSDGQITQWFPVRDEANQPMLRRIRSFASEAAVTAMAPEFARKGFLTANVHGGVDIYHTTAGKHVLDVQVSDQPLRQLAVAPRANAFLAEDAAGRLHFWHIDNEHPEVSWSSLWGKVWYESYPKPDYVWQSSSASNDFEPKFSLTPLAFGTLKAAFYAMLFAMPIAICGAIYAAYFMAPGMRKLVKPTIEIMEALPTVILGFLAGLWLAPTVEAHLPGVFALLLLLPVGTLLFAWLWRLMPVGVRHRVPDGWEAALLIPVLLLMAWASMALSAPLETRLFGGDMRVWMRNELGIGFDQRNALIVGLAMGFAVIPTIFSIAEDAIFSVPRHLTNGSLALGATPWQTLVRVVLLTASPGIFSAVMIGMGRAVGETMIVLMATGNTPVMDLSLFQGMRTLSANIAVEMPEAEVASTHFRILFLAALVLFMFTFVFNTLAELVRQRLRRKYASL
ncbi:MAG: ABC transporter permease subunit [Gammaproteobacteria bacterium]|nr:ABC transporter permease subunit [Gammaproteobacteria bacterium]